MEEIGLHIKPQNLVAGPHRLKEGVRTYFVQSFFYICEDNQTFVLQEGEVEAIKWLDVEMLHSEYKKSPSNFTGTFDESLFVLNEYLQKTQE